MAKYAVSDLHGMKALYDQIAAFIKPEDTVYCLGDCGDRGSDGWATLKAILANPQFTLLMGNHEHMLLAAMTNENSIYMQDPLYLLYCNGGAETYMNWQAESCPEMWASAIKHLPYYKKIENGSGTIIHLTHAGFTPPIVPNNFDLVWSRKHFDDKWPDEHKNEIVIHGHTPIPILAKESKEKWEPSAFYYADAHKIDIDCGSFATGYTILLNLDTFDEHIFSM